MRAGGTAREEAALEEDVMSMAGGNEQTPRGAAAAAAPAAPAVGVLLLYLVQGSGSRVA